MEELTRAIVRYLEKNKVSFLVLLNLNGRLAISVTLQEEPGEALITLLMEFEEIKQAVMEAVKETFGAEYEADNISLGNYRKIIFFTLTKG